MNEEGIYTFNYVKNVSVRFWVNVYRVCVLVYNGLVRHITSKLLLIFRP